MSSNSIEHLKRRLYTADLSAEERLPMLNELAWMLRAQEPARTVQLAHEAHQIAARGTVDDAEVAHVWRNLAAGYYNLAGYEKALPAGLRAIEIYRRCRRLYEEAQTLRIVGQVYEALADYSDAMKYALQALRLYENLNARPDMAAVLLDVGQIHNRLREYGQELEIYRQVMQIYQELRDDAGMAAVFNQMAMVYDARREHTNALIYARNSLNMARDLKNHHLEAQSLCTLGQVYLQVGDADSANLHFQRSLSLCQRLGIRQIEIKVLLGLGRVAAIHERPKAALKHARQALRLAESVDVRRELFQCHHLLATLYKQQGDFEQALRHHERFHQIERQVFNERADNRLKSLRVVHETEAMRREARLNQSRAVELEREVLERRRAERAMQQMNQSLTQRVAELATLNQLVQLLTQAAEIETVLPRVAQMTNVLLGGDLFLVAVLTEEQDGLRVVAEHNRFNWRTTADWPTIPLKDAVWAAELLDEKRRVNTRASRAHGLLRAVYDSAVDDQMARMLGVTMQANRGIIGLVITASAEIGHHFSEDDVRLLETVAAQLAVTIENVRLLRAEQHQRQIAEARNEELDAFARTVAHDLKNPLSALVSSASVLLSNEVNFDEAQVAQMLQLIRDSGIKGMSIIDELLLLAGIRKQEVVKLPLNMAAIVANVQQRLRLLLKEKSGQLIVPDDWPTAVGYAPWIEEVWTNYMSNGIKYGGDPYRLELGAEVLPDGRVKFWLRDNGPGIPPERAETLFDEFVRMENIRVDGHGLGLSIARRIIEKLDGEVGVDSRPPDGSTFYFILPGESAYRPPAE